MPIDMPIDGDQRSEPFLEIDGGLFKSTPSASQLVGLESGIGKPRDRLGGRNSLSI
jgi:hypothetical protein